jgi:hypothetical protein
MLPEKPDSHPLGKLGIYEKKILKWFLMIGLIWL